MKIAFVWDWPIHYEQASTWRDGLAAAVKVLSERHELKFFACGKDSIIEHPYFNIYVSSDIKRDVEAFNPDKIIMWGDCTRPNAKPLAELGLPMALCFAGGATDGETNIYFDHFFVESSIYHARFSAFGKSVSMAFGTNTDLFKPQPNQKKFFDVIFPATYAGWKRHHIFSKSIEGLKACSAGYIIPNNEKMFYDMSEEAGALALPHVSADTLVKLLAASKCCLITSQANGGSQRTVLEAMAMNIPVIVMDDSDKTTEYVNEGGGIVVPPIPVVIHNAIEEVISRTTPWNTRDYILSKWSHIHYANAIDEWINR